MVVVTNAQDGESDRGKQIDQVNKLIEAEKAKIMQTEPWGKKELAYPIQKTTQGYFTLITFESGPGAPASLTSKLNLMEDLLRVLIVKKEVEKDRGKKKGRSK